MTKQLYTTRIEVELMVVAESEEDARRISMRGLEEEASNFNWYWWDFDAQPSVELANGWDRISLPYGKNEDRSVGEWIGAAKKT